MTSASAAAVASVPPIAWSFSISAVRMNALRDFAPLAATAASSSRVVSRNRVSGKTCCEPSGRAGRFSIAPTVIRPFRACEHLHAMYAKTMFIRRLRSKISTENDRGEWSDVEGDELRATHHGQVAPH